MDDHACTIEERPVDGAEEAAESPHEAAGRAKGTPRAEGAPPRKPAAHQAGPQREARQGAPRKTSKPERRCVAPSDAAAASAAAARKRRKDDMPRERLIAGGPGVLSDVEMIALVLGNGLPGYDVFDVAGSLLERFGTLRAMLDAGYADLDGLRGIGPAKKAQLVAILEMARRSLIDKMRKRSLLNSPEAVEEYLRLRIGGAAQEIFISLFLDARHRLIRCEESARGTLTRMAVYPREIVRQALKLNAASLIVAHNHPSGSVQPSASDCRLTQTLRDALALIDVHLIDHLVIGADSTFSFARAGWP